MRFFKLFSELAQSMFSLWRLQDGPHCQQLCQPQKEAVLLCVSTWHRSITLFIPLWFRKWPKNWYRLSLPQTQSEEQHLHQRLRDTDQHQRKEAEQGQQWGKMTSLAHTHQEQQCGGKIFQPWSQSRCISDSLTYVSLAWEKWPFITSRSWLGSLCRLLFIVSTVSFRSLLLKRDWCMEYSHI